MSSQPVAAAPATTLRHACDADSDRILLWRNHPAVRRVMFTDHLIQPAEHAAWWQRVRQSPDHQVLVLTHAGVECGVVTFTRDSDDGGEGTWLWGFYLHPDDLGPPPQSLRAWSGMELASLHWAQTELHASRLNCEVFAFNAAVLAMHRRHGFVERDRYQRMRGAESLEVVRLYRELA